MVVCTKRHLYKPTSGVLVARADTFMSYRRDPTTNVLQVCPLNYFNAPMGGW